MKKRLRQDFRYGRYDHSAVVVKGDNTILILGGASSRKTGEVVKSKYFFRELAILIILLEKCY